MSRTDLWSRAAAQMAQDEDPRWHAVADWLLSEAVVHSEMESFVEMLNAGIEASSGIKGYLRFGRKPDGEISMFADTNEGATAVSLTYLGETTEATP